MNTIRSGMDLDNVERSESTTQTSKEADCPYINDEQYLICKNEFVQRCSGGLEDL